VHGWAARRLELPALLDWQLRRELERWRPDVVHVHGWDCGFDPPGMLDWLHAAGYPTLYTEHNSPDPKTHPPYADAPLNRADVIIAVSQAGERGLREVGRAVRPIVVIPYSVAPLPEAQARGDRPDGQFVITCVARLNPQKGHADLLQAMARVRAEAPQARLQLAGAGPLRAELEAQAHSLGLNGRVAFLGLVTGDQLPELLAGTDVMVLPSYWEGLPVSLIEGLSAGKPIVASDAGGNPELVRHGENGLICAAGDVEALSAALLELARHPERLRAMGEAARRRYAAGDFSPEAVTAQHVQAYQLARDEAHGR
jgi:glycosyltransferase involved in cell wall biosynthesis